MLLTVKIATKNGLHTSRTKTNKSVRSWRHSRWGKDKLPQGCVTDEMDFQLCIEEEKAGDQSKCKKGDIEEAHQKVDREGIWTHYTGG